MGGLVPAVLLAVMRVEASGSCPAKADIERNLGPLLSTQFESDASDVARVDETADGRVRVTLIRADGSTVAWRDLPRAQSCADQAETVAVSLAAWKARIHPDISLRLDHLSWPASDAPDVLGARARPVAAATTTIHVSLGGSVGGGWQPSSFAPAGRLDLTLASGDRPVRGRLSVAGLGEHATDVAPGAASWWRIYAAVGTDYVLRIEGPWALVAGAAGVVGQATLAGTGFPLNRHTRSVDLGGEGIVRLQRRVGRVTPWLGIAVVIWARRQDVEVAGAETSRALPGWEPTAAAGADFLW